MAAAEMGDVSALEEALRAGGDASLPDASGDSVVHRLVKSGRIDLLQACIDHCTLPAGIGADGLEPLALAVVQRNVPLVECLLNGGADPDAPHAAPVAEHIREKFPKGPFREQMRFDPGLTPLMFAAGLGDEEMVKAMLAAGADADRTTRRYRMDSTIIACKEGHIRCAQRLCDRNPDEPTNVKIVVCLGEQRATMFRGSEVVMTAKCSTGRKGHETPTGSFVVTSKHKDWISTIYNVPMPWMMRLNGSAIGLHQGAIPGYPASHGCIRLPAAKAAAFFKVVRVGDQVEIRN